MLEWGFGVLGYIMNKSTCVASDSLSCDVDENKD